MSAHGRNLLHRALASVSRRQRRPRARHARAGPAAARDGAQAVRRPGARRRGPEPAAGRAVRSAHRPPSPRARRRPGQEHLRGDHLRRHRRDQEPKTFTILFVDQRNDRASQLAEAWARKYYPKSGVYMSAGWAPADRLAPELLEFVETHGLDFAGTGRRRSRRSPPSSPSSTSSSASKAIRGQLWATSRSAPWCWSGTSRARRRRSTKWRDASRPSSRT